MKAWFITRDDCGQKVFARFRPSGVDWVSDPNDASMFMYQDQAQQRILSGNDSVAECVEFGSAIEQALNRNPLGSAIGERPRARPFVFLRVLRGFQNRVLRVWSAIRRSEVGA